MKYLLIIASLIFAVNISYANHTWSSIEYTVHSGPVSPEYQYTYVITINSNRECIINYKKGVAAHLQEKRFRISKSQLKKLKKAIINSEVLKLDSEALRDVNHRIGGMTKSAVITMHQNPNLDQAPPRKEIPSSIKPEYAEQIMELYMAIEKLVPKRIRDELGQD